MRGGAGTWPRRAVQPGRAIADLVTNVITTFRSIALVAMLLLPASHVLAAHDLFRGDDRPPETIFRDGFQGPGTNLNVFDHLSGDSCFSPHAPASQRSAYVALTDVYENALRYGRYVYRIAPDADAMDHGVAVDAMAGLRDLHDNSAAYGLSLMQRWWAFRAQSFRPTQGSYVAMDIPGWLIESAEEYEFDPQTQTHSLVRTVDNPLFRAPARTGTRTRFSVGTIAATRDPMPPAILTVAVAPNGTAATACQLPPVNTGCGGSAQSFAHPAPRQGTNGWQCAVEPALAPNSPFHQAVQLLLQ